MSINLIIVSNEKFNLKEKKFYCDNVAEKTLPDGLNKIFKLENPQVKLPPDYLIYESFQLDYKKYFTDSKDTTQWLTDHLKKHIDLKGKRILDWGCGPGRIIRHLPAVIGNGCEFFGTDYNKNSIK